MVKVQPMDDEYEDWDVKRVLNKRENESLGGYDYLVEWENWSPGTYQWLHESRLGCPLLVEEYEQSLITPKQRSSAKKSSSSTAKLATPKQRSSAKKSSSSSAKAKTTPRATPCRRSARVNKSVAGEEKMENSANAVEEEEEESSAVEDEPRSSKQPQQKRRHHAISTSSEDEAPKTKNIKVDASSKKNIMVDASSKKRRALRKRSAIFTKHAATHRSAAGKMTSSPTRRDNEENESHGTPSSDGDAALFGCTPEKVSRPGTPEDSIANNPHRPNAKNLLPKLASPQDGSTTNKSFKNPKRLIAENMELDIDINLEQNMDSQKDLGTNSDQNAVNEEIIEFEGIFDHVNIVPMEHCPAEVKEEAQSEDNGTIEKLKTIPSESTVFTDDEDVTPKDPFTSDVAPLQIVSAQLEEILKTIANDEELHASKEPSVNIKNIQKDPAQALANEISLATEHGSAPRPLVSYSSEGETDDEESMDMLSQETFLTNQVRAIVDGLLNEVCMKESTGVVPALKELASIVSGEIIAEKGIMAHNNYENVTVVDVDTISNRANYKIRDIEGGTFIVESTEARKNPIMANKIVEFFENRVLFPTDA